MGANLPWLWRFCALTTVVAAPVSLPSLVTESSSWLTFLCPTISVSGDSFVNPSLLLQVQTCQLNGLLFDEVIPVTIPFRRNLFVLHLWSLAAPVRVVTLLLPCEVHCSRLTVLIDSPSFCFWSVRLHDRLLTFCQSC